MLQYIKRKNYTEENSLKFMAAVGLNEEIRAIAYKAFISSVMK